MRTVAARGGVTELDAAAILCGHRCHSVADQRFVYLAMVDHYRDTARELRGELHPRIAGW